jgi:hypothetical protein
LGSVRLATPSPQRTFTSYLLPVSRRTRPHHHIEQVTDIWPFSTPQGASPSVRIRCEHASKGTALG